MLWRIIGLAMIAMAAFLVWKRTAGKNALEHRRFEVPADTPQAAAWIATKGGGSEPNARRRGVRGEAGRGSLSRRLERAFALAQAGGFDGGWIEDEGLRREALEWIGQEDGGARAEWLAGAVAREGTFEEAFFLLADMERGPAQRQAFRVLYTVWAATDPSAAWNRLVELGDAEGRQAAGSALVRNWADSQLAGLAETIAAGGMAEEWREEAGRQLVAEWREEAGRQLVAKWGLQDPEALFSWVGRQPSQHEIRDAAASFLVFQADGENRLPEVAVLWAQTIRDPEKRQQACCAAVAEWARTDPESAWQIARTGKDLSEEVRALLLGELQQER